MGQRCPTAVPLCSGTIKGYELLFRGDEGNAYATVERKVGWQVHVGIWELQKRDLEALDVYEGYPRIYQREKMDVTLENGERVKCIAYIMDDTIPLNLPSRMYVGTILKGYADFHLSFESFFEAYDRTQDLLADQTLRIVY